jgi:integrase
VATIHKRVLGSGDTVWELTHGTGRDRKRFVAGRTREEAQQTLRQFERQLALHGEAPTDKSVESAVGLYRTFLRTNRRANTVRRYDRVLTTFLECFLRVRHPEIVLLRTIRPAHIEEYKLRRTDGSLREAEDEESTAKEARLRKEVASGIRTGSRKANARFGWLGRKRFRPSVTPPTVNYELQVLTTFFRWAIRRNLLFVNPAADVERMRVPKRALPRFLTTEQLKLLFAACSDAERRLFAAILMTGMRKGEVEHLTWADVNFDLGVIFIQEKPQWGWKPKTDERVIPISPTLRAILSEQAKHTRPDGLVFPNRSGERDTHILGKLKKVTRKAGVQATVHALRHSFGAHLRMAGVSLADIADLLGHKDLATTQIYAKVHQQHLRAAVGKLGPIAAELIDTLQEATPEIGQATDATVRGLLKS